MNNASPFTNDILIRLYSKQYKILERDYYTNFRLLYEYLTREYSGYRMIENSNNKYPALKWHEGNHSLYKVAEILKISPEELNHRLKELS